MEDLQDKIIELMDLFDGEVTTADKIDRPQQALDREAYKDFMDRNPMAGGGMLVQPSADGSRPGYATPKGTGIPLSKEKLKLLKDNLTNANFINAHLLINWVRYIKSEKEIQYMKDAGTLVKAGMQTAFDSIREGVKQSTVAGKIQNTLIAGNETTQMGGEYSSLGIILASGRSASASHLTPSDKKFENNEGTIIELGGVKHRYHCPLSRTVYVGSPDPKTSDTLKVTNEGIEKALDQTKPGNTCHDVATAFWAVLEKYGLEKESRAGYSIGIGYPPDWGEHTFSIRKNEKTLLESNVTFHLMCGMWMDTWGLELSESVRVTETGYELLTNVPRDLHIVN